MGSPVFRHKQKQKHRNTNANLDKVTSKSIYTQLRYTETYRETL